jgi:general secretion pathway protein J
MNRGFTLLEVVVALVVLGLLLAGLSQGMQVGLAAWGAQQRRIDSGSESDAVDRALRTLIHQIEPGRRIGPANITGGSSSFAFTSILPMGGAGLVTRRADMVLRRDAGHRMVLQWTPHLHVQHLTAPPAAHQTVLLDNIDRLTFSYWSAGAWHDTWNDRVPPALVRIRLGFAAGDPRHWPDLVIAPMRSGPSASDTASQ